ncbi:hypothetical protein GCM10007063_25840 [Lentibacillus kapialis]|uniref:Ureidoglycolate hydrolase n=1 Tax=Lentibacillus kapialis TaxID=340214 RepID=A0A917PZN6_9BACI|nr:ureidoglycolate lyase [Lentibacillus kapialis]GGK02352.1 hypothetical protein GCM10007063_25840 [Lentibacillus kapialis]
MLNINATQVTSENFSKYGTYYNMKNGTKDVISTEGEGFSDVRTTHPLIDTVGNLGFTLGSPLPAKIHTMERHLHTQEALFCLSDPFVITVAKSDENDYPSTESAEAFIVRPGEVVVLKKGVWHDACHGLKDEVYYYWMALEREEIVNEWIVIVPEPVLVDI